MSNITLPEFPAMPDEFACNREKVTAEIQALDEAGEAARYYRSIEQTMRELRQHLDSMATGQFKEALGEFLLREDEELSAANMELMTWGRSARQVLDRIHGNMDKWRDMLFECLKVALKLLGAVMGRKYQAAGRDEFTAYYAALREGSKFRRDRLDGMPLAYDDCVTDMPPFMTGFAQGYYGRNAPSKKTVADLRKAYARGMGHAYKAVTLILENGGMADDVLLEIDRMAKKAGARIDHLDIVLLGELEKLGVTMPPTDYAARLNKLSTSNA